VSSIVDLTDPIGTVLHAWLAGMMFGAMVRLISIGWR